MLDRRAVIALPAISSNWRENVLPGRMKETIYSISSLGSTVSPVTLVSEML